MSDPSPSQPDLDRITDPSHPASLVTEPVPDLDAPLRFNSHAPASSGTGITTLAQQQNSLERLATHGLDRVDRGRFAEGRVGDVLRAARGDVLVREVWAEGWVWEIEEVGAGLVLFVSRHLWPSLRLDSLSMTYNRSLLRCYSISVDNTSSYLTELTVFASRHSSPPSIPRTRLPPSYDLPNSYSPLSRHSGGLSSHTQAS